MLLLFLILNVADFFYCRFQWPFARNNKKTNVYFQDPVIVKKRGNNSIQSWLNCIKKIRIIKVSASSEAKDISLWEEITISTVLVLLIWFFFWCCFSFSSKKTIHKNFLPKKANAKKNTTHLNGHLIKNSLIKSNSFEHKLFSYIVLDAVNIEK